MLEITVEWLANMLAEALQARGVSIITEQTERDIRVWLTAHDAEVRAKALEDAAGAYGPAQITYMGGAEGYVKTWLRARAAAERGEQ